MERKPKTTPSLPLRFGCSLLRLFFLLFSLSPEGEYYIKFNLLFIMYTLLSSSSFSFLLKSLRNSNNGMGFLYAHHLFLFLLLLFSSSLYFFSLAICFLRLFVYFFAVSLLLILSFYLRFSLFGRFTKKPFHIQIVGIIYENTNTYIH